MPSLKFCGVCDVLLMMLLWQNDLFTCTNILVAHFTCNYNEVSNRDSRDRRPRLSEKSFILHFAFINVVVKVFMKRLP